MNPRIIKGHRGTGVAFAVRAHVGGVVFQIGVPADAVASYDRLQIEDRLLQEASSLMAHAEGFDWTGFGFERNTQSDVWEKTLSVDELATLMRD